MLLCSGARDALGGGLARAFWRMRVAGAGGTHSLASLVVSTVVFFVSFRMNRLSLSESLMASPSSNASSGVCVELKSSSAESWTNTVQPVQ